MQLRPLERKLPLRQPGRPALDLCRFWIEQLEYREADEAPDELEEPTLQLSRPVVHEADTEADTYLVTLRILASQGDIRAVDLTICGVFGLQADDDGRDGTLQMLVYNGSAMLFGAARGIIESVTGLTGLGRLRVPSANIARLLERSPARRRSVESHKAQSSPAAT
jgi:preprotein translocase subunit SecB